MLNVLGPEEGIIRATRQYMYHSLYRELFLCDWFAFLYVLLVCLVDSLVFFCLLKLEVFIYHGRAHVVYTPHLI